MRGDTVRYRLAIEGTREVEQQLDGVRQVAESGAKKIGAAFDRDLRVAEASVERVKRRAETLATTNIQRVIAGNTGIGAADVANMKSAEASMRAFIQAQDEQARSRDRLLAQFDPLIAAQQRYDNAIAEGTRLQRAGALTAEQMAGIQSRAALQLAGVKAAQDRANESNRAFAFGMQNAGFQISDFAVQVGAGTSATRAFALQGPQLIQAVAMMGSGADNAGGKFAAFARFLAGPWGAALTVATAVGGALATKLLDTGDAAEEAASGLSTVAEMSDGVGSAQSALAGMFDLTTGALKGQNEMLRANIELMALKLRAEADQARTVTADATSRSGQYSWGAIFRGNVPLKDAWDERNTRARAMLENVRAGRTDASAAMKWAQGADFRNVNLSREEFINAVVRAREIGLKEGTADRIESSLRNGRLDPAFRQAGTARRGGGGTRGGGADSGEREAAAAARELDAALQALTQSYDPLAAAERDHAERLANISRLLGNGKIDADRAAFFNRGSRDELFAAAFAPEIEAAKANDAKGEATRKKAAEEDERRADAIKALVDDQARSVEWQEAERRLIGASADERERALSAIDYANRLKEAGLKLDDEEYVRLLKGNDALVEQGQAIARANRVIEEGRLAGEQLVDTLFDPDNWNDFGELGKKIIRDLIQEMLVLAAINPIKNALFGSDLPTLGGGGIGDFLGGILGGKGGPIIPFGNAIGTEFSDGGWRRVGEFGEELVRMPRGAQVMNAGRTRQFDRAGGGQPIVTQNFDMRGTMVTETVYRDMQRMAAQAAEEGARNGSRATISALQRAYIIPMMDPTL